MISSISNLISRKDLIRELIRSELARTAQETRFGWLWWLLDPIVMMLIYWVFIVMLLGRDKYAPYPIFIGCALLPWKHFSLCASRCVRMLRVQESLIKSVPFPTLALPISLVTSQFVYFLFGFVALTIAALACGLGIDKYFIQLPALMLLQITFVLGVGMALACVGVIFRDLETFVSHLLRIGWYLSPGIYGTDLVRKMIEGWENQALAEWAMKLYMLNPFAILFEGYRSCVHDPHWLPAHLWAILAIEAVIALVAGFAIYQHYDRRVIKFL